MGDVYYCMPSLGADMTDGTLVEWLVGPGDAVDKGDIVAVVETDKGAMEIEVFGRAVFEELLVEPGTKVPVGAPLARLAGGQANAEAPTQPVEVVPAALSTPPNTQPPPVETEPLPSTTHRMDLPTAEMASPAARYRARELGLELASIHGSGPLGAVLLADVEAAAADHTQQPRPSTSAPEEVRDPHAAMRRAIGTAMSRSKREIPHYYLGTEVDLHAAQDWLSEHNGDRPVTERVLMAAVFVRAVALACRKVPEMNGFFVDGRFRPAEAVHVGVAVNLRQGGLVAPAIFDADSKSVDEIMSDLADLVERARAGRLRRDEMTSATLTLTNLGQRGVPVVYPVITPPQAAIVGFGRIEERPWVVDHEVVPRPVVTATLAADHRVSDGHRGGLYLRAVERLLLKPHKLDTQESPQ